jgi:FkbM family methyltransferase
MLKRAIDQVLRVVLRRLPVNRVTEHMALWWGYRFDPKPGFVRLRSGAVLQTTAVDHLQLLLTYLGTFEPHCLDVMRKYLKPGTTLLDVGANIGLFSIEGAASGAKVIAVEAAPQHWQAIKASAAANGFEIDVAPYAAGEADGEAVLSLPNGGNHGMFTLGRVSSTQTITVPVCRIDDIVGDMRIDFIKMDIEGSEYKALLGAETTIARSRPPILIELNERALKACGSSARQVKELLRQYGYEGWLISTGEAITLDADHDCDECLFRCAL